MTTGTRSPAGELSATAARHLLLHMTPNGSLGPEGENLLVVRRGEGPYVDDADGRRYIDGLSGLYCCQLGYSYGPEFAEAADKQLRELCYSPLWTGSAHPTAIELAERLSRIAPVDIEHTFFCGGGAEAVETAWKIARRYHCLRGEPGRVKAISRRGAYHGLTVGAMSFTDDPGLTEPYGPPAIGTRFVSNTNRFGLAPEFADDEVYTAWLLAELEAAILAEGPETVALLIAEPVQNRGGCITPPKGYWQGLRVLADRYGFLLVADEVITGFGRVGEWFGGGRYGARPDMVTVAKGITSGYAPLGATLVGTKVTDVINRPGAVLNHGYTFAGHPLSAAIALRNLEIMERDRILDNVRTLQDDLARGMTALTDLPIVGDVRGAGFFYACELVGDLDGGGFSDRARTELVTDLIPRRLREAGLLARVYNRSAPLVQIAPPLVSDRALLDRIAAIIAGTLAEASARL
ncbi:MULTISPECIES: aminotransferase class III-fold pyridoxal phosphate-dependent enzyme [Streptomyces]|uniref:Adenosylmethionine-8-amino-7-oxononanoate transaminase n=1 Tax=Streptomyces sviceus (strain ATCC 29083 / DSM 924 / JCM 4929 / NBRC 13980 / NCIMB 11184 / NRRL 5439 / UC 5370) TaxID=463191 RepID=B5I413_STRX2|nr:MULTISPECIES: aminotransferase class III-fold pyridoxal phosphate-dependent enzyme [Streptomyces]EDY59818.1 adenosylmethionine-8-amino-7-oxononanoate transaminase [Streptomyces sviceus ATCC 29083]MYT10404.1 aminotransferase class III-fold pyridoxal phosphate-dependent enzyme [Streptomyces sp. SID5470]